MDCSASPISGSLEGAPQQSLELCNTGLLGREICDSHQFSTLSVNSAALRIAECSDINLINSSSCPTAIKRVKCVALPDVAGMSSIRHWRLKWIAVTGAHRNWIFRNS